MQAIILAAGESTRTHPLTITKPKPLLKIANKTILEHNLDALYGLVSEAILVVGYQEEMIKKAFGSSYKGIKLRYIEQKQQLGTGHALLQVKKHLKQRFLLLYGDNIYHKKDIQACLRHKYAVLATSVDDPEHFGVLNVKGKKLLDIEEKPKNPKSFLINTGLYVLDKSVLDYKARKTKRKEYELTDMMNALCKKKAVNVEEVKGYWLPIGFPWDMLNANEAIVSGMKTGKKLGTIESRATIKGTVAVGKNTIVKNGAYIEGPVVIGENCIIGPNCYIRKYTSIGNNCKIGNAVELKNSVIGDNTSIGHLSYIGDSVVGEAVNLGAGTITANLKHNNSNVRSVVKNELIDSCRRKFGAIISDGVHTGINTSIYPGRKLWPAKGTMPGEVVKKDVK